MATHSSILAWTIPWTEEPGGLKSDTTDATEHVRIQLIYNVVLVSDVQYCLYTYILFFIFFSTMVYPRRLNTVPCTIR